MAISEKRLSILTWALGILVTVMLAVIMAGIPWAFSVQSNLVEINTKLGVKLIDYEQQLMDHEARLRALESR